MSAYAKRAEQLLLELGALRRAERELLARLDADAGRLEALSEAEQLALLAGLVRVALSADHAAGARAPASGIVRRFER